MVPADHLRLPLSAARRRQAKADFKAAWEALKARTTPEQLVTRFSMNRHFGWLFRGRDAQIAMILLGACCWCEEGESEFKARMSKTFRGWNLDQALLLPPSVQDFVPSFALGSGAGHGAA